MTPRQAWQSVPRWLQVLSAIGGIALALLLFGERWVGLPAQVEMNTRDIRALQISDAERTRQFAALVCLLSLPDTLDRSQRLQGCEL